MLDATMEKPTPTFVTSQLTLPVHILILDQQHNIHLLPHSIRPPQTWICVPRQYVVHLPMLMPCMFR